MREERQVGDSQSGASEGLRGELDERDVDPDPFAQLGVWLEDARAAQPVGWDAAVLATSLDDVPSARAVIVRGFEEPGLVFYTDRSSRKGRELTANSRAAIVFVWPALERSVRVEGDVSEVGDDESDAYFASRPRGSTLSAWASNQSEVIESRSELEAAVREAEERFGDGPVPRPPRWGGYRVVPSEIEFWQGRPDRLHDRLRYRRDADGRWVIERLSP
jgi:pyridoxamine 5'-phosphate oxidase